MSEEAAKTKRFGVNQLIPTIATAVMAVVFIWLGLSQYGFWHKAQGPMPGFFPIIIAVGMFLASILAFIFSFKDASPVWPRDNWMAVLGGALIIAATFLIGMIASVALYVLIWLKWYEKCSWKMTLITLAFIMAIVVGCFVFWLDVPFPKGLLFDAILG